jgi:HTH-type transcriptional regulator / antitoxin HipB
MKRSSPQPTPKRVADVLDLGEIVREKRRLLEMTQADLAGIAGVGARFLSEVERGKETAEVGRILHVLARLGLDVWVVPRGSEPPGR